ncbi:MAG: response regulator [Bacteroidales bacterium]|nr:response regulator [Candidatus Latescibacterota bacterium]
MSVEGDNLKTAGESVNILIVEDNPDHALLASISLEKNALWNPVIVDNLENATIELKKSHFKVILTNYRLPDGNGLDLLDVMGTDSIVIVMTNQGNERVAVHALQKGAYDYVVKDTMFYDVLPDMIQKALDKYSAQQEVMKLREKIRMDNEKLMEANRKLKELDNIKSEFISTASHELRTPLTIIREFVSLTKDGFGGPVTMEQEEYLDSALNNCDRLGDLINEILDLQKMESGRVSLKRRKVDIERVLKAQYRDFKPRFAAKEQNLNIDIELPAGSVICDEGLIIRVLVNLLGNANKYVQAGGATIIRGLVRKDRVVVEIEDDGPGIAVEEQGKIFERFTQIGRCYGPGSQGTGLGLAIARKLIEMNEGTISVRSEPDKGSIFTFSLPKYSDELLFRSVIHDALAGMEKSEKKQILLMIKIESFLVRSPRYDGLKMEGLFGELEEKILEEAGHSDVDIIRLTSMNSLAALIEGGDKGVEVLKGAMHRYLLNKAGVDITSKLFVMEIDLSRSAEKWAGLAIEDLSLVRSVETKKKVLVVDDDIGVLNMIRSILTTSNFPIEMEQTLDGYDACIRYGNFKPDLVVLDINMPYCDIAQVLRQIKKSDSASETKVLLISGDKERFSELMELGADDYIAKPFDVNVFLEKIGILLDEDRLRTVEGLEKALSGKSSD